MKTFKITDRYDTIEAVLADPTNKALIGQVEVYGQDVVIRHKRRHLETKYFKLVNGNIYYQYDCDIKLINELDLGATMLSCTPFHSVSIVDDCLFSYDELRFERCPETRRQFAKNGILLTTCYF